jgi:23S rRNA-/tRNA-specific pseudouridylate synthase
MDHLRDNGLKAMVRVSVLHPLDDIDGLFLGDPKNRPSMAVHEDMWLKNAETVLTIAEREYARLDKTIAAYGGPENVTTVG